MTRKQKILSVLLGAVLVLSVVAATYAYFTASVNRTGNTGIVEVTTTELANLAMTSMKSAEGSPIYPGWVGYQGINVSATGSGSSYYDLSLEITGGSNVKGDVLVTICKVEDSNAALAAGDFTFTAATAQVDTSYSPVRYYMTNGSITLPSPCTNIVSAVTLASLGSSYQLTASGGKEIAAGKNDKYYISYTYENKGQSQVQGENFTVTPVISARGGVQSAGTTLAEAIISKYGTDANLYYHTTDTTKYQNGEGSITSTYPDNSTTETFANLNAGDGSYRYSGLSSAVHNYICFGTDNENTCLTDTSNNGTSKYLYRIIGVFDNGSGNYITKIIMSNVLYNPAETYEDFDSSYFVYHNTYRWDYNGTTHSNEWANASLKQWLNGEQLKSGAGNYYPTTKFLDNYSSTWTMKIEPTTWYVRGLSFDESGNAKIIYTYEVANVKNGVSGYTTNYQGNSAILANTRVGLMYISDYMYGASPTGWNYGYGDYDYISYYDNNYETNRNWMNIGYGNSELETLENDFNTWTITPILDVIDPINDEVHGAYVIDGYGRVSINSGEYQGVDTIRNNVVRPVMYLSSDVEIDTSATNADGSSSHPYMLSAE